MLSRPAQNDEIQAGSPGEGIPAQGGREAGAAGRAAYTGPERWADIKATPRAAVRARIAEQVVRRLAGRLRLRVMLPAGDWFGGGDAASPLMRLRRPQEFYRRVGVGGLIGFGEAYQAGDWDAEDLPGVLETFAEQIEAIVPPVFQKLRHVHGRRRPAAEANTLTGARSNISRHYDLSDELFALFLDSTMSYSSALFSQDEAGAPIASSSLLALSQRRKIDRLLDLTSVGSGTRVLEIGTGWGELAVRAAGRGAKVHSVTISRNQYDYAARQVALAGLSDLVTIELRDYRELDAQDLRGRYDAIVSVEMIEAVGREYWPEYFADLDRLLAPGGRIGLQAITMPHRHMVASADTYTWIHKYIFPGGLIPSVPAIEETLARHTGLRIAEDFAFGAHYAATLRLWRERFRSHTRQLSALGFDETFRRTWELYLAYCEAGFRAERLDVHQFLITRAGNEGQPAW
ncbi:MAG TPA: cyclopropane-fatty-acyl-phospholipid synthase family protein [Actinocrinis sp.]|nr:cyclopropane-fatty-acyl-phospholipid synthase family protein [Actinocrinis sp.]